MTPMKKFMKNPFNNTRSFIFIAVAMLTSLLLLNVLTQITRDVKNYSYTEFIQKVRSEKIKSVRISDKMVYGQLKDGSHFETTIGSYSPTLEKELDEHKVDIQHYDTSNQMNFSYIMFLAFLFLGVSGAVWFFFLRNRSGGKGGGAPGIFTMGKSRAKLFLPSAIKVNFDSVAGVHEAKEELQDIVEFLKDPEKYRRLGAKVPKGLLLIGEPGNGKTLLARAVAGEASCPFFSVPGSDFIEVFVGVGAARVRDLFAQARKKAPCIVFIDEIDAIGRQRGVGMGGGHDEREQTLNQLLTEMDGFQTSEEPIIIIGATNMPEVLDKALLRPGRFDRKVFVPYPDLSSREAILEIHAKGVKISDEVDLYKVARGTPGFSGADLANLINEAALNATKNPNKEQVTIEDFEEARDKITMGKKHKSKLLSESERKVCAYHEAGHTLALLLQPKHTEPLHKVTIIPRGSALGVTHWLPERDKYTGSKEEMLAFIRTCMGGRAAEELIFNIREKGAHSDFDKATKTAIEMVCFYGMTDELGPVVYNPNGPFKYSQKTAERIDDTIKKILETCLQETIKMLKDNKEKLETLANALLDKETMHAEEIYELLGIEPRSIHKFA